MVPTEAGIIVSALTRLAPKNTTLTMSHGNNQNVLPYPCGPVRVFLQVLLSSESHARILTLPGKVQDVQRISSVPPNSLFTPSCSRRTIRLAC